MILYNFVCDDCGFEFERLVSTIADRDLICHSPCPSCDDYGVRRVITCGGFSVPEGSCGNAKNNYSSYHGDSANAKAGRKIY